MEHHRATMTSAIEGEISDKKEKRTDYIYRKAATMFLTTLRYLKAFS